MISRAMPPIDLQASNSMEESAQAMAFTYLSYFNNEAIQPRVLTSYKRAWGCDQIIMFPRSGVTPGFVVAIWLTSNLQRMLIAVEGTTSRPQIINVTSITGWTSRVGIRGYIYAFMKTHADAIYAQLLAHVTTGPLMIGSKVCVTWTGHSLGAAVADINAVRHKTDRPTMHIRLVKFGSPQVGNATYVNNSENTIPWAGFYVDRDPIHRFPSSRTLAALSTITTFGLDQGGERDAVVDRLSRESGRITRGYTDEHGTSTHMSDLAELNRPITPGNRWYDHLIGSYRTAFMSYVIQRRDPLYYRFMFLEHNNENRWYYYHQTGARDWLTWNVLEEEAPPEVDPPSAQVDAVANSFAAADLNDDIGWGQATVPQAIEGQTPAVVEDAGAPGAWGTPTPRTRVRTMRPRRPTPTPAS